MPSGAGLISFYICFPRGYLLSYSGQIKYEINYLLLHKLIDIQRPAFFAVRISLGLVSMLCEVKLYRTVVEKINERVGRYLFIMLLSSAGMWNASTGIT